MKKYDVLVVGELNVDLILDRIEHTPEIGKEVFCRDMTLTLGSSSAIFANNISILGARTAFVGLVGQDNFGDLVLNSLERSGVGTEYIGRLEKEQTGLTMALSYGEDRAMVTYPGAMRVFSESDVLDEMLAQAGHMHVSSIFLQESLLPTVTRLFRRARSMGLTTSLDPQWDPNQKWDIDLKALLPHVDIFLPNEAEITAMTRTSGVEEAVSSIRPFAKTIVIKQGKQGALMYNDNEAYHRNAFESPGVVDAIGAGDSFNAGFIYAFLHGRPLADCLECGALTGALNTTAHGGTGAFKDSATVDKALRQYFNKSLTDFTQNPSK